jgi:hypothetical protein
MDLVVGDVEDRERDREGEWLEGVIHIQDLRQLLHEARSELASAGDSTGASSAYGCSRDRSHCRTACAAASLSHECARRAAR